MPTYEYLCKNCGERFEKFQSFSARPLKTHDTCGGEVQKVFHASGVVFKGPGFYATDNRSSGRSSTDTGTDGGSNDSKSKESKPKESATNGAKSTTSSTTSSAAAAD